MFLPIAQSCIPLYKLVQCIAHWVNTDKPSKRLKNVTLFCTSICGVTAQLIFEEQHYNFAEKAYNKLPIPWRLSRTSKSNTETPRQLELKYEANYLSTNSNQTFRRAHNARKPIPGLTKCPTRPHQAGATPLEPHEEARTRRTLPGQGEFSTRHTQYRPRYKPTMKYCKPASNAGNLRANSQSTTRTGHATKSITHSSPNVDRRDSPFARRALARYIHS